MRIKIVGIISFISASMLVLWIGIGVLGGKVQGDEVLGSYLLCIGGISTVLYIIWTKFGSGSSIELKELEYENKLLQKKIEQQELKKKLS